MSSTPAATPSVRDQLASYGIPATQFADDAQALPQYQQASQLDVRGYVAAMIDKRGRMLNKSTEAIVKALSEIATPGCVPVVEGTAG